MAYTLKSSETEFRGGKQILASEHVQYVHGGATLDGSAFPEGYIEVGMPVARDLSTGKYVPYKETTEGTLEPGVDNFYILNEDHDHDGVSDFVSGAVIIEGSVYEDKLPEVVTGEFKKANPNIHYVRHI